MRFSFETGRYNEVLGKDATSQNITLSRLKNCYIETLQFHDDNGNRDALLCLVSI